MSDNTEPQVTSEEHGEDIFAEMVDDDLVEVLPPEINKLIVKRNHSGNRIIQIIDSINTFQNDVVMLETRRDMLKQCYRTFDALQSSLEQSVPDEMASRDSIELKYIAGLAALEKIITMQKATAPSSVQRDSVRLPTIDLPTFSGANDQWLEWVDKFNSLIHNRTLPTIQKFEYLKVSLRGPALGIVDSLPTTEGNYQIAYDLLFRRYNNPKLLVQQHIRELFELKPMDIESASGLRELFDRARKHLRCLETLAQPVHTWDAMLIHLVANKLDSATRRQWETAASGIAPPTYEQLENFVLDRCQVIDAMPIKRKTTVDHSNVPPKRVKPETRSFVVKSAQDNKCAACSGYHFVGVCDKYRTKSVEEKFRLVKRVGLCFNCLSSNHTAEKCRGGLCRKCKGRHHTSLHRDTTRHSNGNSNIKQKRNMCSESALCLIPTASVLVRSKGRFLACRVLLDSGSQSNFVTQSFVKRAGLLTQSISINVRGFGNLTKTIREKVTVQVKARTSVFQRTVTMLVTDCIADPVPNTDINVDNWLIPDVTLADPEFHLSRPVDMLLGVTVLMEILKSGSHQISPHLPHLQNTQFGWIVGGSVTKMNETNKINQFINESTQNYLSRTWSEEENKSELLFQETTTRDHTGRFIIRLPLKDNYNQLGESRNLALNRFLKLELRFEKDPVLHKQYNEFMYNYLEMGHMEMVPNNDLNLDQPHFYFPHHPVLRPDSSSTKLRTVFNGSASTSSGLSLNDVLLTGPTIQKDIFDILLRFRCHKYVLTGDIQKMFRQIMVHSDDRNFQLILWRFSTEEAVQTYRLNTVTYGTCSAPFIAARCLHQLGIEFQQRYPEAGKIVLNDFYMDDVVTGHEDKVKLLRLKQELEVILTSAGFELHKWKSNEKSIVSNSGEDEVSKILGILWNTGSDSISFGTQIDQQAGTTKRNILSEVQKIFDPLGIVSPIVILGKIIMQDIWSVKINWDDELPVHIISEWKRFCNQLKELERIEFPRHVRSQGKIVEIHGFSDAAKRAYGAAVYIRTVNGDDKVSVSLLCAKSRVTPTRESGNLDDMTIPRMELRAASLMVELTTKVIESLSIPIDGVHYWSDSMVTLEWIRSPNKIRPAFISNRVKVIHEKTEMKSWHHVRSKDNPADLISRGTSARKLLTCTNWWHGPSFLTEHNGLWQPECTETVVSMVTTEEMETKNADAHLEVIENTSSVSKLQRIIAYCLRFVHNCQPKKAERINGQLSLEEIRGAHRKIIFLTQWRYYGEELSCLTTNKPIISSSPLLTLNPFIGSDGLMRVGGRIQAAGVSYDQQHPIILPTKSNLALIIIRNYHIVNLHVGVQSLLYSLRLKYWIPKGRSLIRKIVHQCVSCFRQNPKSVSQIMGEIPEVRLNPGRPFKECGVDFGGPFTAKENFVRTQKTLKVYVALFVCLRTRAIHLELVSSLTSSAFIAALRRFSGVRGRSAVIYCDNATNFTGSKNELKQLTNNFKNQVEPEVQKFCTMEGINWKFIPPRSPSFGGIWEAGIKSVKSHMRRILGSTIPTYEELLTLFKQIEGCLNSRPISPMSTHHDDPIPLTPGHFLIGEPITALPDDVDVSSSKKTLCRFEQVQKNVHLFWKRWQKEYLNNLQQRAKKLSKVKPDLLIGKLCLVKEDNLPPCVWITGRVKATHPGPDGRVRVVTLKTIKGEIKRSVAKLCPLPIE